MLKRLVTLDYSKSLSRLDLHSLLQYEASAVGKKMKAVATRVLEASPYFLWKFAELLGWIATSRIRTPRTFFFGAVTSLLSLTS